VTQFGFAAAGVAEYLGDQFTEVVTIPTRVSVRVPLLAIHP
jgi:hypothetical protein